MSSLLPDLVKVAMQFLLTANAAAAGVSIGILSSATSASTRLAAIPAFLSFGAGLICGVLTLTFYLGYLIELYENPPWARSLFGILTAFAGLLSITAFIVGVVLAMHAVIVLGRSISVLHPQPLTLRSNGS